MQQQVIDRFMSKVEMVTESGCWIWMGATNGNSRKFSYGQMHDGERTRLAHRLAVELFDRPVPGDMMVCHRCDVTLCVNPAHLFVGSRSDNMLDASKKWRTRQRFCKRGHEMTEENTYTRASDGMRNCVTCKKTRDASYGKTRIRFRARKQSPADGEKS